MNTSRHHPGGYNPDINVYYSRLINGLIKADADPEVDKPTVMEMAEFAKVEQLKRIADYLEYLSVELTQE